MLASLHRLAAGTLLMTCAGAANAQCTFQKIIPASLEGGGWSGAAVAMRADTVVMGEPFVDATNVNSGRVSIFKRSAGGSFNLVGFADAPNNISTAFDGFGTSVAYTAGGVAVIGAPYAAADDKGMIYFAEDTGPVEWTIKTSHTPADAGALDRFGCAVAADGQHALVGASHHDIVMGFVKTDTGGAYFYKRNPDGTWSPNGKADEPVVASRHVDDHFGAAVALEGEFAIVGCPDGERANVDGAGFVHVYKRISGVWQHLTTITPPGGGQVGGGFGRTLAYDGEYLVVGAPQFDFINENSGRIYIYRRDNNSFVFETQLGPDMPNWYTQFGHTLAVANGRVAVGTLEQEVHLYHKAPTTLWVKTTTYSDPDAGEGFGLALAASNENLLIGDPLDDNEGEVEGGAAYWMPFGLATNLSTQAPRIRVGDVFQSCTFGATNDGGATCGNSSASPDVWYMLTVDEPQNVTISTEGSGFDTVLSVHSNAPGNTGNQINCNDDDSPEVRWSRLTLAAVPGQPYFVRIAGYNNAVGHYTIAVTAPTQSCPGDVDGDGQVNFNDLNAVLGVFNTTGQNLPGDFDNDGDVDFADLNVVLSAFNTACN